MPDAEKVAEVGRCRCVIIHWRDIKTDKPMAKWDSSDCRFHRKAQEVSK